jgi:hypothetical protein
MSTFFSSQRFTVRDWTYNPENASSGAEEQKKQENKRIKQKVPTSQRPVNMSMVVYTA